MSALRHALSHHQSCGVILSALIPVLRGPLRTSSSAGSSSSRDSSNSCQQAAPSVFAAWSSRAYSNQPNAPQHKAPPDPFGPLPAVQQRRVVVTGIGMVTPLGVGVHDSWQGLIAGRTGVRRLQAEDLPEVCHAECCSCGCA